MLSPRNRRRKPEPMHRSCGLTLVALGERVGLLFGDTIIAEDRAGEGNPEVTAKQIIGKSSARVRIIS